MAQLLYAPTQIDRIVADAERLRPGEDLSALLRRADEAMYAAKRSGRSGPRRARLGRLLGSVTGRRPGRRGAA